ncbi:3-oxoacyl-ACP reductase [Kitasatospora herbaricolor]|uniref:3-oxoacyl-ACP reductase n=1 Tax=Kitasatospora herbaricolor TaxID=68217 RepID=A0ABZ1W5B0_9ACTN|nr:3-oxoacyl-ACP reductase [Kitasatospora herbaricolor]
MADVLQKFTSSSPGRALLRRLGVQGPVVLPRHEPGRPEIAGPVLLGGTDAGRLRPALAGILRGAGVPVLRGDGADGPDHGPDPAALVFDATGLCGSAALAELYEFAHPLVRRLPVGGRVVIVGDVPEAAGSAGAATAAHALEGFTRSLGKELGRGGTCQLLRADPGAEQALDSPLRFLLSRRSAYVSGQVVRVGPPVGAHPSPRAGAPQAGRTVAVTGAARGIGAVVAELLARDGAHLLCLDLPARREELERTAARIGGTALAVDVTAADASEMIAAHLRERHGGVDVFVHNAGVTRDRTLARMARAEWDTVLDVNLGAVERITAALLADGPGGPVLRDGGALVCTSSIGGIAGNRGQTNYGAAKAGLIGLVRALAPVVAGRGVRVNAVAPGFIETDMTARMPLMVREAGRRMNSLGQGGLPVDVAEAVRWLAEPANAGVTGQVLRVCGQSLIGA